MVNLAYSNTRHHHLLEQSIYNINWNTDKTTDQVNGELLIFDAKLAKSRKSRRYFKILINRSFPCFHILVVFKD